MFKYEEIIESKIILNGSEDWKKQINNLEQSFKDFYLLSFTKEYKKDINCCYHIFKYSHKVQINII
jgi:hypothetical protein